MCRSSRAQRTSPPLRARQPPSTALPSRLRRCQAPPIQHNRRRRMRQCLRSGAIACHLLPRLGVCVRAHSKGTKARQQDLHVSTCGRRCAHLQVRIECVIPLRVWHRWCPSAGESALDDEARRKYRRFQTQAVNECRVRFRVV